MKIIIVLPLELQIDVHKLNWGHSNPDKREFWGCWVTTTKFHSLGSNNNNPTKFFDENDFFDSSWFSSSNLEAQERVLVFKNLSEIRCRRF